MRLAGTMGLVFFGLLYPLAPAQAEINAEALAKYEAAGADVSAALTKVRSANDIPLMSDRRYGPVLRTLTDLSLFGNEPLTAKDARAMQRISKVTSNVMESYAGFIGLVQTAPGRRDQEKIVPLAELSGQFLTFYMHTSAGHADVFTDAVVTNPNNLPQDQLQRAAGFAHNLMVDTVRTAAQAAADDSPWIARRASLAALDATMPRLARTLPPAKRREAQLLLTGVTMKNDAELQGLVDSILFKLRDAPCNPLCQIQPK